MEQVATGMRWAEGPVYFPEGGYVLVSDVPTTGSWIRTSSAAAFTVFRANANYANGNARDRQGRLVTCEHSVTRRVTRTERDGTMTVLADSFEGKRLNAPDDIVVKSDDSLWFTDPIFGINGEWEGSRAKPDQATTNVYRIGTDGKVTSGGHRPRESQRPRVLPRREEALRGGVEGHAQPQHLKLRRRRPTAPHYPTR